MSFLKKRRPLTKMQKRQYIAMAGSIASTLSLPLAVIALLNEKPGVTVETEDPERIIARLREAYANNQLQYAERYSEAVQIVCKKYGVGVDQLNRAMARDPVVAKEIYATMDREFEKDIKAWRKKMKTL
jgi:hypothetical protein